MVVVVVVVVGPEDGVSAMHCVEGPRDDERRQKLDGSESECVDVF